MMKTTTAIAITSICSLALGGSAGYFLARRMLINKFQMELEAEIQETKAFFKERRIVKDPQPYDSPEDAVKALIPSDEAERLNKAAAVMRVYRGDTKALGLPEVDEALEEEQAGVVIRNVLDSPRIKAPGPEIREMGTPYPIDEEDFMRNDPEHENVSLTYYIVDDTLADDADEVIENAEQIVGKDLGGRFREIGPDITVIYIRNEMLGTDFEIARGRSYADEVLGLNDRS